MYSPIDAGIQWHAAKKFLFRFLFVYLFFYCFPFPFDSFDFTKPVAQPYYDFLDRLVPQIGVKWFHIQVRTAFPMFDKFDDSGYGLVFIYFNTIFSVLVACIWSIADRRRNNYEMLYQWLRLYVRYFLVAFLFGYGFIKVFPSQFQAITASRLTQLVGDQSPMLLAWNFMGYSVVMMRINGILEVGAGLFLLFRRTTTIGALLSASVFSFVVMMDFCFNVPVRLLASHLLSISLFLVLEDRQKLVNVFLLNKATDPTTCEPLISGRKWQRAFFALQILFATSILYTSISAAIESEKTLGQNAPVIPLYGVYNTVYFIRNNDTIPASETDSLRWKQLVIDGGSWNQSGIIQYNTGRKSNYIMHADTIKKMITIQSASDSNVKYSFDYSALDEKHLYLKGLWARDSIKVSLNKYDLDNYLLHKEKFKWISF